MSTFCFNTSCRHDILVTQQGPCSELQLSFGLTLYLLLLGILGCYVVVFSKFHVWVTSSTSHSLNLLWADQGVAS